MYERTGKLYPLRGTGVVRRFVNLAQNQSLGSRFVNLCTFQLDFQRNGRKRTLFAVSQTPVGFTLFHFSRFLLLLLRPLGTTTITQLRRFLQFLACKCSATLKIVVEEESGSRRNIRVASPCDGR